MNPESVLTIYTQDLFQLEDLEAGFVETLLVDGPAQWLSEMPWMQTHTKLYAFNYEQALAEQTFVADPNYSCENIVEPTWAQRMVDIRHMRADTRVAVIDIDAYGGTNPQGYARAKKIAKVGKQMTWAMLEQFIHGTGACVGLHGVDHWLDWWGDVTVPAGMSDFGKADMLVYWTDDAVASCDGKVLSLDPVRDLLSRTKCGDFTAIYTDRQSVLALRHLYDALGGNTAPMVLYEWYDSAGRRRTVQSATQFDGVPVFQFDILGKPKRFKANTNVAGQITVTGDGAPNLQLALGCVSNELVINSFIGFSSLDLCRRVRLYNASNVEQAPQTDPDKYLIVTSVVDAYTITIGYADGTSLSGGNKSAIDALSATNAVSMVLEQAHAMYALNFGPEDIYGFYVDTEGMGFDGGACLGSVAGFTIREIGMDQSCEFVRDRLVWYGNVVQKNPFAAGRLSHYLLPQFETT